MPSKFEYKDSISYGIAFAVGLLAAWIDMTAVRCLLALAAVFFLVWPVLHRRYKMTPAVTLMLVSTAGLGVGGVWWLIESQLALAGGTEQAIKHPDISFQKYAVFWVKVDDDVYQLGVVAKFLNLDDKSYLVKNIEFERFNWSLYPRGSYLIQRIKGDDYGLDLNNDNYFKPNSEAYFKLLTHIKGFLTVNGGDTPELIIRGAWDATVGGHTIKLVPRLYSVYPTFISSAEWDALNTSKSPINVDGLHFKPIPPRPTSSDGPVFNYLVFNSDRTATIDNVYFAQTPPVKGKEGVMLFIRGKGTPPLGIGWSVLGNTYAEVWSNPDKLALYNSLYPPDKDGLPRPFGFFAGAEGSMAGALDRQLFAPTTVGADVLEIDQPREEQPH